jgi:hypothetical protein
MDPLHPTYPPSIIRFRKSQDKGRYGGPTKKFPNFITPGKVVLKCLSRGFPPTEGQRHVNLHHRFDVGRYRKEK